MSPKERRSLATRISSLKRTFQDLTIGDNQGSVSDRQDNKRPNTRSSIATADPWPPLDTFMQQLKRHRLNKKHHSTLLTLRSNLAKAAKTSVFPMPPLPTPPSLGPGASSDDLARFEAAMGEIVLSYAWSSHAQNQTSPARKTAMMIEGDRALHNWRLGRDSEFPKDRRTPLEYACDARGRPWSIEAAARYAKALGFGTELDGGDSWSFHSSLGKGGNGHAGLWIQRDDMENIIDRIVIKETWLGREDWKDISKGGVLRKAGKTNGRMAEEAYIHTVLTGMEGSDQCIVDIRASSLYDDLFMYRLYLEHCEVPNDLEKVISNHAPRGRDDWYGCKIPQPVIWAVFDTLAQACFLMKYGQSPSIFDIPVARSQEIVHLDLKPQNVFLKSPDPTYWPNTPGFRLGDFGLAVVLPSKYITHGTVGYQSPEQAAKTPSATSATNVWGVGAIIASMMGTRRNIPERADMNIAEREAIVPENPARIWQLTPDERSRYRGELLDLMDACCEYKPENRISIADLCERIRAFVNRPPAMKLTPRETVGGYPELLYDSDHGYARLAR